MFDVVSLGEVLIDFIPVGISQSGCKLLEASPGGSPCNMLAVLSKFGKSTTFIGKVGNDEFGHFLSTSLSDCNIDTSNLVFDSAANTTLAFIHLGPDGQSAFSFYRNPGADMLLNSNEIKEDVIANSKIFYFGSFSLSEEPVCQATLRAVEIAKKNNLLIAFSPNFRPYIWKNFNTAKNMIKLGLKNADIVKITSSELDFIYGKNDVIVNGKRLLNEYNIKFLFVTGGEKGAVAMKDNIIVKKSAFEVQTVDNIGSGNAFLGAVVYKILNINKDIKDITEEECEDITIFANATAALSITKHGGFLGAPSIEEVQSLINSKLR